MASSEALVGVTIVAVVVAGRLLLAFWTSAVGPEHPRSPSPTLEQTDESSLDTAAEPTTSASSPTSTTKTERTPTATSADVAQPPKNPWRKDPVVVELKPPGEADEAFYVTALRDAANYWEVNAPTYLGYSVNFTLTMQADDPDVRVFFPGTLPVRCSGGGGSCALDTVGRNGSYRVGVFGSWHRTRVPRVFIVQGLDWHVTANTAIHEFGHVLGIRHCEPPHSVMDHAPECEDRTTTTETVRNSTGPTDSHPNSGT